MTDKENKVWDFILNNEIATKEELELATQLCGTSIKTLNRVIYCRTAYHDMEQCLQCEPDNFVGELDEENEDEDEEDDEG